MLPADQPCARQASPAQFADDLRGHGTIEHGLHWMRNVTVTEDACRARTGTSSARWRACAPSRSGALRLAGSASLTAGARRNGRYPTGSSSRLASYHHETGSTARCPSPAVAGSPSVRPPAIRGSRGLSPTTSSPTSWRATYDRFRRRQRPLSERSLDCGPAGCWMLCWRDGQMALQWLRVGMTPIVAAPDAAAAGAVEFGIGLCIGACPLGAAMVGRA